MDVLQHVLSDLNLFLRERKWLTHGIGAITSFNRVTSNSGQCTCRL